MRNVSNRVKIWAYMGAMMVILYTYTHISLPFKFMKGYGKSTNPSPQELGSMSFRTSITDPHGAVLWGNQRELNQSVEIPKFKQVKERDYGKLPWWDGGQCICDSRGSCKSLHPYLRQTETKKTKGTTCGQRAAADGDEQRVISLSLYGENPGYWNGLPEILSQARLLYPEWKVWLYTNPRSRMKVLCPLLQKHDHLRICDVTNLPQPLSNISKVNPMFWRIAPLGDPKVGSLLVRDSDSKLTEREQKAVQEWLESGKTFHVMRDHPQHTTPILGGMWGARWGRQSLPRNSSREENSLSSSHQALRARSLRRIRNKIFVEAYNDRAYGSDQVLLARILWPSMWSVMAHDSFYCEVYSSGWRPWPTERVNGSFVGLPRYRREYANITLDKECPLACRPPNHLNWLYC
ncbi:uncharacterized protein LOC135206989 [Macrobrachium nipponense]|uniref:uncharacterized protein LOC135206989 n=1 Tax=Macrobrachium nipponense TaxID=159736 RepID=UPI0030C8B7BE